MKRKIVLPSVFVLVPFLVGLTPKTSKAELVKTSYNQKKDSVSYNIELDSCYQLHQTDSINLIDSINQQNNKDSVSYDISWNGGLWVKYTSSDGSGFIRTGGSRTWRNMNPGAIRYGEFSRQYGACGKAGGFAVFPTEEHGMNALKALLTSPKYINLTVAKAIYKWAPPSDNNNTKLYQIHVQKITGIPLNKKLSQLTPAEIDRVATAIKTIEGWKAGIQINQREYGG
jgi:hypothetical protein